MMRVCMKPGKWSDLGPAEKHVINNFPQLNSDDYNLGRADVLEHKGRGSCDGNDEDGEDNREDDYAYKGDGHHDEDGDGGDEQEEEGRLRIRVSLEGMWFWRSLPAARQHLLPPSSKLLLGRVTVPWCAGACILKTPSVAWENKRDSPQNRPFVADDKGKIKLISNNNEMASF